MRQQESIKETCSVHWYNKRRIHIFYLRSLKENTHPFFLLKNRQNQCTEAVRECAQMYVCTKFCHWIPRWACFNTRYFPSLRKKFVFFFQVCNWRLIWLAAKTRSTCTCDDVRFYRLPACQECRGQKFMNSRYFFSPCRGFSDHLHVRRVYTGISHFAHVSVVQTA